MYLTTINYNLRRINGKIQSLRLPGRCHFAETGHVRDLRDGLPAGQALVPKIATQPPDKQ
jgi:hypothetical protein